MWRVAILDELTPAVAAWQQGLSPGARKALLDWGRLIRSTAKQNIQASFKRTGRNRTGGGGGQRGLKIRSDQQAGITTVRVWHGSGILAAHELGATIPPATIRPVNQSDRLLRSNRLVSSTLRSRRVLAWGGPPGQAKYFASVVHRRGFTLRRRATLEPAYAATAEAGVALLEQEYQRLLDQVPPGLRS